MSVFTDHLREVRIFNPHNAASVAKQHGGFGVYVNYRKQERGRVGRFAAWQVIDVSKKTDPAVHWMDNGNKTFGAFRTDKQQQREAAIKWAAEYTGVPETEWVAGAFAGTIIPKSDLSILKKFVKESA